MLSVLGQKWVQRPLDERLVLTFCQKFGLSEMVSRVLVGRGLTFEEAENFLSPSLRFSLPDPSCLLDMDRAVERTLYALQNKQKITVYGDYDVDGATSTALLRRYFNDIGYPVELYIPDRIDEGYGANTEALLKIRSQGSDLVLMTDCGTTAVEPLTQAQASGLDVVVLDHHLADVALPPAFAIVNPNRLDQPLPPQNLSHLCAAGIAFLFLIAFHRALRSQGWFSNTSEPDLRLYLDLVALGTVCDVMGLTGLNRTFVSQGLKILRMGKNLGLQVLSDITGLSEKASVYHLGFLLGPCINAGGRVGEADLGSRLLTTQSPAEARDIAAKLVAYNQQRQLLEKEVLDQAHALIARDRLAEQGVLVLGEQGWHPGVIGIVASRLKDHYHLPSCVVAFDQDEGKGSGRSISGIHLGDLMHHAVHQGLLVKGGGHAMAAGFTVLKPFYEKFRAFLAEKVGLKAKQHERAISFDGFLTLQSLTPRFFQEIEKGEPFGMGNPAPSFVFEKLKVRSLTTFGNNHIRCLVANSSGFSVKALAFRYQETLLGELLKSGKAIDLLAQPKQDTWGGRCDVTLMLQDGRVSQTL